MKYSVAYNNEYLTSLVPRPSTPQSGKLIAFEIVFLESKEYLLIAMLLFQINIPCGFKNDNI